MKKVIELEEYLRFYKEIGLKLTPLKGKSACLEDWYNKQLSNEEILNFLKKGYNIGALLGETSGWFVDVDIDHPACAKIIDLYLNTDTLKFGRQSKPLSHLFYISKDCKPLKLSFNDCCFIEIRSTHQQTMIPPSIHPEGEKLTFKGEVVPPIEISSDELHTEVRKIAAATLLGLNWNRGQRQDCALALAGGLLRAGWSEEETEKFIQAVCIVANDEEPKKRAQTVLQTLKKQQQGLATTGWHRLIELMGSEIVTKVISWLEIRQQKKTEIFSAVDLMSMDLPPLEYLLPNILPAEGITILAGKEKIGKSWLVLGLALSLSSGSIFLGQQPKRAYKVLYLALEDSKRRLQNRIKQLGQPISQNCLLACDVNSLQELEQIIRDQDVEVVIIDTLQAFKQATNIYENPKKDKYERDYNISLILRDMTRRLGCSFIVVHHTKKGNEIDFVDEVIGRVTAGVDTILHLQRARTEYEGILKITGKDVETQELALKYDKGRWEYIGAAQDYTISNYKKEILDYLKEKGEASPKEIAQALDKKESTTRVILKRMTDEGLIEQVGRAKYKIKNSVNNVNNVNNVNDVNDVNKQDCLHENMFVNDTKNQNSQGLKGNVYNVYNVYTDYSDIKKKVKKIEIEKPKPENNGKVIIISHNKLTTTELDLISKQFGVVLNVHSVKVN